MLSTKLILSLFYNHIPWVLDHCASTFIKVIMSWAWKWCLSMTVVRLRWNLFTEYILNVVHLANGVAFGFGIAKWCLAFIPSHMSIPAFIPFSQFSGIFLKDKWHRPLENRRMRGKLIHCSTKPTGSGTSYSTTTICIYRSNLQKAKPVNQVSREIS